MYPPDTCAGALGCAVRAPQTSAAGGGSGQGCTPAGPVLPSSGSHAPSPPPVSPTHLERGENRKEELNENAHVLYFSRKEEEIY